MKPEHPLVSVCITTYNLEEHIGKTLDSVLTQETSFPFEIVVHDDASTDRTVEIIQEYEKQHPDMFKTIFQEKNIYRSHPGGLGHIFNSHLLPQTSGTYIAICDGDDYWTDDKKLEKQVRFMEQNPEYAGCFTNATVINEMSGEKSDYYKDLEEGAVDTRRAILNGGSTFPTSTLLFRKEDFISSPFFEQYEDFSKHHEYDTLFINCLIMVGDVAYIDDITAVYRRWPQGLYSGILDDSPARANMKERELYGNKKLLKIAPNHLKPYIRRKISIDALFIVRSKSGPGKWKHLLNLTMKELMKWVSGR
ncbi:glycosyltransferase [Rhodohalobacter sp. 8-1]|uniref:glycosyltransferase n=1 Tax=Rhodohalobacter sp. 8-1 TaxID=3131972 RepID=UPI0030EEC337